jgi:endonuclease/exonuclease/phosphatase family metal-dependent hydrolase
MKRVLVLLLAAAIALATGCTSTQPGPQRITVLTYNIHHGEGMDKKLDLARIAKVIRAVEPDFVALQELDTGVQRTGGINEPEHLARLTKMHGVFGPAMDFQGGKYGDAVLSRGPIVSSQTLALPYRPGNKREPRVAVEAVAKVGGEEVVFISTHLDHTAEPSDRLEQANQLNAAYRGDDRATILAGDFNCEPGSPPMRELSRVWTVASNADPSLTCPADVPTEKIDHVLLKPAEGRWRVVDAKVIDERVASDHRPVVVKLELIPPGWIPRGGLVAEKK